jgi:hypothetical protein
MFNPVYQCAELLQIGTIPQGQYLVVVKDLTTTYTKIIPVTLAEEGEVEINVSDLAVDHTYRVEIEVLNTQANQPFTIGETEYTCGEFLMRRAVGEVIDTQILIPKA